MDEVFLGDGLKPILGLRCRRRNLDGLMLGRHTDASSLLLVLMELVRMLLRGRRLLVLLRWHRRRELLELKLTGRDLLLLLLMLLRVLRRKLEGGVLV